MADVFRCCMDHLKVAAKRRTSLVWTGAIVTENKGRDEVRKTEKGKDESRLTWGKGEEFS